MTPEETLELVEALDTMGQRELSDWVLQRSMWDDWDYIKAEWNADPDELTHRG